MSYSMCVLANIKWCSLPEIVCVVSDEMSIGGTFTTCNDCHKNLQIKNENDLHDIEKSCPNIGGWEFKLQTRKCENVSPNCFSCDGG